MCLKTQKATLQSLVLSVREDSYNAFSVREDINFTQKRSDQLKQFFTKQLFWSEQNSITEDSYKKENITVIFHQRCFSQRKFQLQKTTLYRLTIENLQKETQEYEAFQNLAPVYCSRQRLLFKSYMHLFYSYLKNILVELYLNAFSFFVKYYFFVGF